MPIHDWTRVEAGIFHDVHATWIVEIKRALNAGRLPQGYYALAEQDAGEVGPDVLTLQMASGAEEEPPASPTSGGSNGSHSPSASGPVTATATPPRVRLSGAIREAVPPPRRRPRRSVVIRHISGHRIVAIIEVLSPSNKNSAASLRSYLGKAVAVLRAGIHLVILDLFPPGRRDPHGIHAALLGQFAPDADFTPPDNKPLTLAAYTGGAEKRFYLECAAVGDPLPELPLFLDPEHYIPLPLESTYQAAWDAVPRHWRDIVDRRD